MAVEYPIFPPNTNLVMACHISGVHDVNRNTTLANDSYELVKDWAQSVTAANLQGIIFHNNFSEETCKSFENENITLARTSTPYVSASCLMRVISNIPGRVSVKSIRT